MIYLIIIFNVGSDLEVERWRKTNEKKEGEREGGCVCERDSKFRGKLVTAQGNKVNAKNNPGAHFPVNVWSRSTHTQTQHTHTLTHIHKTSYQPYAAESKPIESIARKHDMTFQIH